MMYKCENCGGIFDRPLLVEEDFGYETCLGHVSAYQQFKECPYCSCNFYYEVEQCEECGEWFPPYKICRTRDKERIEHLTCEKCEEKYYLLSQKKN